MLELQGVSVEFGRHRVQAVRDVNLEISGGQRLGLIGESGSGKTALALAIMGLLPENARLTGSIRFNGRELVGLPDEKFSRLRGDAISLVFQEPMTALDPTMAVGMQVAEVLRLHYVRNPKDAAKYRVDASHIAAGARQRVLAILEEVGVHDPQRVAASFPHQLSGGQRQRVLIAMALINRPELVILDEPTTALDVRVQAQVLRLIGKELTASGGGAACLFISHDLAVVSQVCDEVAVMYRGRIVEQGSVRQIFLSPEHPYTHALVAAARGDVAPGERLPVLEDFGVDDE
ncbi:MAG: ABC transporter ATP-binding protein [Propionibacteriaceae bacterium]|nr:ABC transporter ATP-binding protein [Propionibacteriaceae bacterium]